MDTSVGGVVLTMLLLLAKDMVVQLARTGL
jgi:hypothetical protein